MIFNQQGFTILDVIFAVVILGVGLSGMTTLFSNINKNSGTNQMILSATQLAQEKLEEMSLAKKYNGYSYINTTNYPTSAEDLTASGFAGWTRTTTITEVQESDLSTAQVGSGYKKVSVTVTWTGGSSKALSALFTNY